MATGMRITKTLGALVALALGILPAQAHAAPVVYEPFDITNVDDPLNGKATGTGLSGNWGKGYVGGGTPAPDLVIGSGSLNYGNLQAGTGNHVLLNTNTDNPVGYKASVGSTLTDAGLMADGATLWFSFVMQNPTDINQYVNNRLMFYLGSQDANTGNRDMLLAGHGLGLAVEPTGNGIPPGKPRVRGLAYTGLTAETLGTQYTFPNGPSYPGTTTLFVGKITWGADGSSSDTIEIYAPDTSLNLGDSIASLTANVDQSTIDRLYIGGKKDSPIIDEIRIGATYNDLIDPPPPPKPDGMLLIVR